MLDGLPRKAETYKRLERIEQQLEEINEMTEEKNELLDWEVFDEENIQKTIVTLKEMKQRFFILNLDHLQALSRLDPSHVNALAYIELIDKTIEYAQEKRWVQYNTEFRAMDREQYEKEAAARDASAAAAAAREAAARDASAREANERGDK